MKIRYLTSIPNDSKANKFPTSKVVFATVIGVSTLVLSFLLYFCIKRICRKRNNNKFFIKEVTLRRFSFAEVQKATKCFSDESMIGSGAFGNVYKGIFDGEALAIKREHVDSYENRKEFKNEVELLWRVKHPNLVRLVGFCQDADHRILVYEYIPNGTLLEYIAGKKRKSLTWRQRVNIAIGAAKGIAHLHESADPSIIHRDIKPSNILIGEGFEAKVSDFGLVRSGPMGEESHVSSQIKGTPGYMDPAYCSSCHLSTFSDVYSYGVILLQLISSRPAIDANRPKQHHHIIDWASPSLENGIVQEILDANLLLEACNTDMMLKMGKVALKCVVENPKNRPTMSQVVQELEDAMKYYTVTKTNMRRKSIARDESMSFSISGVGLEKFHIDADDISIQSVAMKCLDVTDIDNSHSIDVAYFKEIW